MTYTDLLQSELLFLPLTYDGKSFNYSLRKVLRAYLEAVEQIDDGPLNIKDLEYIDGAYVRTVQQNFTGGLLAAIDAYHDGKPAKAYKRLTDTLNNKLKDFREILKIRQYSVSNSFFRMRIKKSNFSLLPLDMFHIPFELRGLINTQRYSIPGFPCLYLGRTLYGCWEEMNRPDISEFQAARLKNMTEINYLDLTRPAFGEDLMTKDVYHYFMTWPLIACCSVKVFDYTHSFKSEYIVPQLLLQWVREQQRIDGIRFNSTHIDFHNTKSVGDFSNLVLPVRENKSNGHCPRLKSMFEISDPISWQLYEHAIGGETFIFGNDELNGIDSRIPKLELIKGRAYPYSYSILGKLEAYLDGMPTRPL